MIYFGIALGLFLVRLAVTGNSSLNRQVYPFVLIFLFLFSAFRLEVGCDWSGYQNQYDVAAYAPLEDLLQGREALWWAILYTLAEYNVPYPWINVISSAVAFAGIHVLARRQLDPLGFLVLLFPVLIVNVPMSAIRQGAAIGILCIALVRLLDGRALAYAFWVLMATGFHSSAAIFFLLTPLIGRKITRARVAAAVLLAAPGVYLLVTGDAGEEASGRYINSGSEAFGAVFRIGLIALSGAFYFAMLRRCWHRESPSDYNIVTYGALAMMGAIGVLPISTVIADRLGYYLVPLQTVILARIGSFQTLAHRDILVVIPYITLLAFLTMWIGTSSLFEGCYLPYRTWLFGYG